MTNILIHSDGGARGNPGPAGVGVKIEIRDGKLEISETKEISEYIGEATNNQAEYTAVVKALEWVESNIDDKDLEIEFFLDSQLVVEQLNGNYKMKNEGLKPLFEQIRGLIITLGAKVSFSYIPRAENKEADALVNKALDKHQKG